MANTGQPPLVAGLRALSREYRALLCDVWGVIHDGVSSFPAATAALSQYRAEGGKVVLITNAPRPKAEVVAQLDRLAVPRSAYDSIVTSGEVARSLLAQRPGLRVLHVGPARDLPLYEGIPVEVVGERDCQLVSCTGLEDDTVETPDDYAASLTRWQQRGLPMLCSNPDIVVQRGSQLVWCAGALAERYREIGGEAAIVGKPHADIYRVAQAALAGAGPVLAVGDGVETDVRGANAAGLDVAFVTGGIHAAKFGRRDQPDLAAVHAFLADAGAKARAVLVRLAA